MSAPPIVFGTSGWRGILGDDFTFANLRRVTRAVAGQLREESGSRRRPKVFIGYDTRFLSEQLAREVAQVLVAEGVGACMAADFVPTPVVAHAIREGRFDAGINLTASHNPAEYNGFKLSTRDGAPAPPEVTRRIEALARDASDHAVGPSGDARIESVDPAPAYRTWLQQFFRKKEIARARLRLVCDPVYGAGRGYLSALLKRSAVTREIRAERDVTFGGHGPDCNEKNLAPLAAEVRRSRAHLGLATDGDADRFGIVDRGGHFMPANLVLALLADYLLESRRYRSGIARTVATTHLLDDVAAHHGVTLYETPVGFKHFQSLLLQGKVFLAGEESSGLTIAGHVPEKDGILAGCLVAEMVARRRRSLRQQVLSLFKKVGPRHSRREDYRVSLEQMTALQHRLESPPDALAGKKIREVKKLDGTLMSCQDGSWLLLRPSGTEPLVRCYAEAREARDVSRLLDAGRQILMSA